MKNKQYKPVDIASWYKSCDEEERQKKLARDNRSMQMNPNNWRYQSSRQNKRRQ